jgi:predicted enzyme related to lactoylglutathione lyase
MSLQDLASLPPGVPAQPGGFELNFEVEDLDAAYQQWKAKGMEVLTEMMDMGAGRFFRAKDANPLRKILLTTFIAIYRK